MATIKSFTSVEQSRTLAEILPLESADMVYIWHATSDNPTFRFDDDMPPMVLKDVPIEDITADTLPCWSLAALLDVLPKIINHETLFVEALASLWHVGYRGIYTVRSFNLVDACYEMVVELHEQNLL